MDVPITGTTGTELQMTFSVTKVALSGKVIEQQRSTLSSRGQFSTAGEAQQERSRLTASGHRATVKDVPQPARKLNCQVLRQTVCRVRERPLLKAEDEMDTVHRHCAERCINCSIRAYGSHSSGSRC